MVVTLVQTKNTPMKNLIRTLAILLLFAFAGLGYSQDVTTVYAASEDISQNLDLEAVASMFGESKNLEDFEQKLNNPEIQVSNLDLNEDGYVDYLRVVETSEDDVHLIAIQSVLGEDIYQDVATVQVEKDNTETSVRVVGDVYLYGPSYVITPVYVNPPVIFGWFWGPLYRPYRSVFYWGYYPKHYRAWKPFPTFRYRTNVAVHININNTYKYTSVNYNSRVSKLHTSVKRNDFAVKYPNKSYAARTIGINKPNGTKKRAAGVKMSDGTTKRVAGVNQADGDKYRTAGVNKPDGTKKRAATVKNPDGSRKSVAVKKNPNGTKRAISVKKDSDGNRAVKTGKKNSKGAKKAKKSSSKKTKAKKKKRS